MTLLLQNKKAEMYFKTPSIRDVNEHGILTVNWLLYCWTELNQGHTDLYHLISDMLIVDQSDRKSMIFNIKVPIRLLEGSNGD